MAKTKKSERAKEARKERSALLEYAPEAFDEDDAKDKEKIGRDHFGRPTVMTKQTLQKLEWAFKFGCTDEEACIFAGIGKSTFYNWLNDHEHFREWKEELKQAPVIASRMVVYQAISEKGSVGDAWAMLRAKRKQEFAELKQTELTLTKALTADDLEALARGEVEEINPEEDDTDIVIEEEATE